MLSEISRLRLAAVVEGIVLGRVAAHRRQRAATLTEATSSPDFDTLFALKRPDKKKSTVAQMQSLVRIEMMFFFVLFVKFIRFKIFCIICEIHSF